MVKARLMKLDAKCVQIPDAFEDQPTSCNVIHSGLLHTWKSLKLVEDRACALMALGNCDSSATRTEPKDRLKRVKYRSVGCPPFVNDAKIIRRGPSAAHVVACAVDSGLGASGERLCCGFRQFVH